MKYGMIDFLGQKGQDEWVIVDVFDYKTNGFFVDLAAQHAKIDSNTYVLEKDLKTKTLEYVLDKYDAPSTIDYLNLDIEGAETRVLRNFPFDKYKFLAITIERPTAELEENLKRNGYVFVKKSRVKMWEGLLDFDSFYVHESIPNFSQIMEREG